MNMGLAGGTVVPASSGGVIADVNAPIEEGGSYTGGRRKQTVNVDYEQELILDEDDDLVLSLIQDFVRWQ
jgi:hypothetical protein